MTDEQKKKYGDIKPRTVVRLSKDEIIELRRQHTYELREAAEADPQYLEGLQRNEAALKESGIKPEKLPFMIENMRKAFKRFDDAIREDDFEYDAD